MKRKIFRVWIRFELNGFLFSIPSYRAPLLSFNVSLLSSLLKQIGSVRKYRFIVARSMQFESSLFDKEGKKEFSSSLFPSLG